MQLQFLGATRTVTGSKTLVQHHGARPLRLDWEACVPDYRETVALD